MTARITYLAYKFLNSAGHLVFETDFSTTQYIKPEIFEEVVADLGSLFKREGMSGSSELMMKIEGVDYVLRRSTTEYTWTPELPNSVNLEDSKIMVIRDPKELEQALHQESTSKMEMDQGEIKERLTELLGEKAETYLTNIKKLSEVQSKLDLQKKVDQAHSQVPEVESEIEFYNSKLEAVGAMAKREVEISSTLTKYTGIDQNQLQAQGDQYKGEVKSARIAKILSDKKGQSVVQPPKVTSKRPRILSSTRFLIALAVALVLSGVIGFIVSESTVVLGVGVGLALLEVIVFAGINMIPPQTVTLDAKELETPEIEGSQPILEEDSMSKLETFFLDKAWMEALQHEVGNIRKAINEHLDGRDFEEIKSEKGKLEKKLSELNDLIKSHEGKDIPPEEYLKKRREVDLLKIEKSRLESEFNDLDNSEEIFELIDELDDSEREEQSEEGNLAVYAEQINPSYKDMRFHDGSLEVKVEGSDAWEAKELDQSEMHGLLALKHLDNWLKVHATPIIFADFLDKLSGNARTAVDAKITHARNLGQVIVINPLA